MGDRRSDRRFYVCVLLACLSCVAISVRPAVADPSPPPIGVYESGHGAPFVGVTGSDLDDRISIDFADPDFVISSPNGVQGCNSESPTVAHCPRYGSAIGVFVAAGDDRITLKSVHVRASVQAGLGSDVLNGSPAPNYLSGQGGDDLLRGGDGKDTLDGGKGVDRLLGGEQKDRIYANDGRRDDRIDCGGGEGDLAVVDGRDPKPIGCERVQVRS